MEDEEFIFSLIAGQDFGDIALLSETNTRTCTIRAASNKTKLIELSKKHFLEFINEYKTESVAKMISLLEDCLLLKGVSMRSKKVLASKSYSVRYPANTVILRQGEETYNIYFVFKGSVSVIRRVEKKDLKVKELNPLFEKKHRALKESTVLHVENLSKKLN